MMFFNCLMMVVILLTILVLAKIAKFLLFYIRCKRCLSEIETFSQLFLVQSYRVQRKNDKVHYVLTFRDKLFLDGLPIKTGRIRIFRVIRLFESLVNKQVILPQEGETLIMRFDKMKLIQTLFESSQKGTSLMGEYEARSALTRQLLSHDYSLLKSNCDLLVEECEYLSKEYETVVAFGNG
ncbi:MAG: hypothetical protein J6M02_06200 [Clostridia bacterium]|nr:hypothetical protein [Clostridia bacterium]